MTRSWLERFRWTPHGYERVTTDDNPRRQPCPFCGAAPGHDCTRTTRGGVRVAITGYHDARTAPVDHRPTETPSGNDMEATER